MNICQSKRNEALQAAVDAAKQLQRERGTVHYYPLSGGNYVIIGPKGVKTIDDGPVVATIRKVGTLDADNPNQVSVGIYLDNGHSAIWNGKEFEVEDLGVPLKL